MCFACYKISCLDVSGCVNDGPDADLYGPPAATVRDYTALLAYFEYENARFNALMPTVGAQVFVTYSFIETAELPATSTDPYGVTDYWAFDATQRASTRLAMAELSRVSGVVFVESTGTESMLQVFGSSGSPYGGWAHYPFVSTGGSSAGRMVINMDGSFAPGTSAYQVILHELGHAVGLKHPFEGDLTLASDLDNTGQTLMSYSWTGGNRSEFSPLDVQALQHLYGTTRANAGWVYAMDGAVFTLTAAGQADVIIGVRTANLLKGVGGGDQIYGGGMDDTLYGGGGNDSLEGGAGNDRLFGGAKRDALSGGHGDDRIRAGADNDRLTGGHGDDTLLGEDGNDRIWGDQASDGWGDDRIYGGDGDDTIYGGEGSDKIWGDAGNDTIYGDMASGGWGADTIYGGDGDDWIHGGEGFNTLDGGAGNDTLIGGSNGHMKLYGGAGDDHITAAQDGATFAGWDTIQGGAGNDWIVAAAGSDRVLGGSGKDTVFGGAGWDTLYGGNGNDRLLGEDDNDDLYGGAGDDTLFGGNGFDEFWGGAGRDRMTGGAGIDYFRYTADALGATDIITDFTRDEDAIILQGLGFLRSSLQLTDHANGTDMMITVGPAAELSIQLLGIRVADFDQYDIFF